MISTSTGNGFCSIMASTPRCGRGDLCSIHSRGNPIRKATFGTECNLFFCLSDVDSTTHTFPPPYFFYLCRVHTPTTTKQSLETISMIYFMVFITRVVLFFLLKKKILRFVRIANVHLNHVTIVCDGPGTATTPETNFIQLVQAEV